MTSLISIERQIRLIHGQKVLLDSALAELYGVETKVLFQAIRKLMKQDETESKPIGFLWDKG
ncbi:MAG: hypothetical protein COB36_12175 [Alphaproteobacteria bacterium]|nr:MAG: hypothetical protein COB36_12175 [Alphaproteobacteria bacterium]